ncbi:MAG: phosphatase PAP2 family protein [Bacteroidetes bacterium]|nr:phosphatase PAP2 family protein [Bacteroidota bacterium]
MKTFLKNNWYILTLYLICIGVSVAFLLSYGKIPIHLYINQFVGNKYIDNFFYYITFLGDGRVMPFLLAAILIYNIRTGLYATASFAVATTITSLLKYHYDVDRPFHVFKWTIHLPLKYVDAGDLHIHNSFPSGHATQAFAIFMCLVFCCRRPELKFLFFILALMATFSRVYLSQHWLVDITAGSIIGTFSSLFFYFLFIHNNRLRKFNKPLFKNNRS